MLNTLLVLALAHAAPIEGWQADAASLAAHHAPVIVQEAHEQGGNLTQDLPVDFDFDGDWDMRNNWANQPAGTSRASPVVHWSVVATRRHAWITYFLYYPRDWSWVCLPLVCHENDLEQFTLVVANDGGAGRPLLLEAKYHRGERGYPVPGAGAVPRLRTAAVLGSSDDGRPLVRVEWGGHGVTSCDLDGDGARDARCVRAATNHTRVLHPPGARPIALTGARPPQAYELRALHDTLWSRRSLGHDLWAPGLLSFQGRRLGRLGRALGVAFAGSRGGARAPWGVRAKGRSLAGERFFDPAAALTDRWILPGPPLDDAYVENRFVDDLRRECDGAACDGTALATAGP
jgi:hypothetical protein